MLEGVQLAIYSDYGTHVVPDSVRSKIWGKLKVNGDPDRRFKSAKAIERYYRLVLTTLKRRWIDA